MERPSCYTVNSLATALAALYRAGGSTRNGAFRRIRVKRGGKTVQTINLYKYFLEEKSDQEVRLRQGEIVFVPVPERQGQGPVTRPAIYEPEPNEELRAVLRYAGGEP